MYDLLPFKPSLLIIIVINLKSCSNRYHRAPILNPNAHPLTKHIQTWLFKLLNYNFFLLQIDRIVFCLFLPVDVDIYEELFQYYFPLEDTPDTKPDETEEKQGILLLLLFELFLFTFVG